MPRMLKIAQLLKEPLKTRLIESVEIETSLNIQVGGVILASLNPQICFCASDEANASNRSVSGKQADGLTSAGKGQPAGLR